ncbi:MAG: putative glycoside hydrolase [Candidatus Taylorbacteria bacterium]
MMYSWLDNGTTRVVVILLGACFIFVCIFVVFSSLPLGKVTYSNAFEAPIVATSTESVVTHIKTPDPLKAVYLTGWAAGNKKFRDRLFDLVDTTEINAVVIDVKDYSGRISFPVDDPMLVKIGASQNRIPDVVDYIARLHARGVYVIARISSFQDSFLINVHPEWAVKTNDGKIWQDYKGVKWLDAGAQPVWDYLIAIGKQSYAYGFDELNFDYMRYPSDGNLDDVAYSWSAGRNRREVMHDFYLYMRENLSIDSVPIPISADLFGLTTSSNDDLGIGQVLVDALPYFDYVSPMVYPSHFSKGYLNLTKPALQPYEVVKFAMSTARDRAIAASSSPNKLRPWLQAFDLGAVYTPDMVRAQIRATNDVGLSSWSLWDAASVYDKEDLLPK